MSELGVEFEEKYLPRRRKTCAELVPHQHRVRAAFGDDEDSLTIAIPYMGRLLPDRYCPY